MVTLRIVTLGVLVSLVGWASSVRAEVPLPKLNLTGYVGPAGIDDSYGVTGAVAGGFRVAFIFSQRFGLEASYGKVLGDGALTPTHNYPLDQWGFDVIVQLRPDAKFNPYVAAGWAQLTLDTPPGTNLKLPGWELGGGLKYRVVERRGARVFARLDIRSIQAKNEEPLPDAGKTKSHWFATLGLTVSLGNLEGRDADGDGVQDKFDKCPETTMGAEVDPFGCPLDYDEDGIPDGLDRCPSTPHGARVDDRGCPSDVDGDGVMDGIDLCNATIRGALVDPAGCALDTDGDGVFDGLDQCPGTPPRTRVDEHGCALTTAVSRYEVELRDTGKVILYDLPFEPGTAQLKPEAFPVLEELGATLVNRLDLQIEVAGYTDATGDEAGNLALSEQRSLAVLDYLVSRYLALNPGNFRAVGYGEADPIDGNDTDAGRARNRRIEFRVQNPEALQRD